MSCFDPSTSVLAGMDTATLQAELAKLQQGYLLLSGGQQGVSFTYQQNGGSQSVTYTKANLGELIQAIRLIQAQLGIIAAPRRSLGVQF